MSNDDGLNVWYNTDFIGQLWRDPSGIMGFRYDRDWIKQGFPLSQQLPLSQQEYPPTDKKAHQFFANLLPEAGARTHIVRDLKIVNSDFALLKAIGGECAGALSLLPMADHPHHDCSYEKLTPQRLSTLLKRKGCTTTFISETERPRLSLAGAQDKCPVLFCHNEYFIPKKCSASTHIIKFEVPDYRHIPAYEYFLTALAKTIALPVVECFLKKQEKEHFLLIKRYDRIAITDREIKRLHQEDFCQATGTTYEKKYQADGGPSFHDCYSLIQQISINPILDAENLLKWQIFNVLAGNSDGHAKNLSLLYNEQHQARLAPFYDLVCTRAIPHIDAKLAFAIGGTFDPGALTLLHWRRFAQECHIREHYLIKILQRTAEKLLQNILSVRIQFEKEHGSYPAIQRVQHLVVTQCKKTLNYIEKNS
jgi:serine/threonine-protein kinase HipA